VPSRRILPLPHGEKPRFLQKKLDLGRSAFFLLSFWLLFPQPLPASLKNFLKIYFFG
jgi:hypothetical protein